MSTGQTIPARLVVLERVLRERVSKSSGGWPHWLHIGRASTSLVGTAHTVAMLRMLGLEANDELVMGGLRYLAREVREQIKPGGRGVYARYPAYALWGLMRFPGAIVEPEVFDGAKFSASWLAKRDRLSGAWTVEGARGDDLPISLPATMAAVHGLDRFAPYVRGAQGSHYVAVTARARDAVAAAAISGRAGSHWCQRPGGTSCPGATSLAVLTLAGGSPEHRAVARKGLEYLRTHRKAWTTSVHVDDQLEQLTWRIMSFSLGLRALLHPCATKPVTKRIIQDVVSHFDALWDESTGAWAVQQGHEGSTTGSYAVLAAVRALKNAAPFDPVPAYRLERTKVPPTAEPASTNGAAANGASSRRRVRLAPNNTAIYVCDPALSDQEFYVAWGAKATSQWGILEALLRLKGKANERSEPDQYDYTLSPAELATYAKAEVNLSTVERTVRRINERIAAAAGEARIHGFSDMIEKIVPGDSVEFRYGIEETQVELPPPA